MKEKNVSIKKSNKRERSIKGTHSNYTHRREREERKFERKLTGSDTRCKYKNIIGMKIDIKILATHKTTRKSSLFWGKHTVDFFLPLNTCDAFYTTIFASFLPSTLFHK
jgi:hypothetical protein